ncbi:AraC family transcriptional regulator [Dyadobacter sp. CY261]|uniref:helix-turn-helix transcriptional regulator n=1 Tax=Dyadobacter sp. CY261 TaxID=2907203 RepID=UPI001F231D8C|nr:AraC family transcriptional regulator [Dyadobacter sp. CY261]MCF0075560.1 AraC family transcriptional regulator [Dyadobacter sp. CY261]
MTFSFSATPDFDFLNSFARHIRAEVHDNVLEIPKHLGHGYIRQIVFGPDFEVTLHHFQLKEDLIIRRNASAIASDLITVFFYSNDEPLAITYNNNPQVQFSARGNSAIQVTSNDLSSVICFPAQRLINYMVIAIRPDSLKEFISIDKPSSVLETITGNGSSFLFFENMSAETKLLLKNMIAINMGDMLSNFYVRIKVQELLYHVFYKLSLREHANQAINSADISRLLYIRDEIVRDLSKPPVLRELSQIAAMSETKLKSLFKQTYGTTIYNYFQQARMEEAAFLLKKGKRSVAQVGYDIGFTNLSHFSRLFERHYGQNPKRFSYS